jgi:hypothetical protein
MQNFWGVALIAVSTVPLYFSLNRVRTTRLMQAHMLHLVDGLWADAVEANQQTDKTFLKVYNLLVEVTALAPAIAAGVVEKNEDVPMDSGERHDLEEFLGRNAWAGTYLLTATLAIWRLEFHGRPLKKGAAGRAFIAWALMTFALDQKGAMRVMSKPDDATDKVEEITQLRPRDRFVAA